MSIAKAAELFAKYDAAVIAELFHNGPKAETVVPEHRHGWIVLDGKSYDRETVTGEKYDGNQGGWAWI